MVNTLNSSVHVSHRIKRQYRHRIWHFVKTMRRNSSPALLDGFEREPLPYSKTMSHTYEGELDIPVPVEGLALAQQPRENC